MKYFSTLKWLIPTTKIVETKVRFHLQKDGNKQP